MGLFSSKYKTTVGTSVTRVVEDDMIPDSIQTGMTRALNAHDDQFLENVMEELTNSLAYRAERMYRYGRDKYLLGLPKATGFNAKSAEEIIQDIIEDEVGSPVTIDYCHYGPINALHVAWKTLQDNYFYDPALNRFVYNGYFCYLNDLVVNVKEATTEELNDGSLEQWGIPPKGLATPARPATGMTPGFTPIFVNENAQNDYVEAHFYYVNMFGMPSTDWFNINITGFSNTEDYFHVKYTVNGQPKYWLYKQNSGTHPSLDKLYQVGESSNGTYFPWVYFRHEKKSLVTNKTTEEYKQATKLCNYIGMDFDTVATAIDENPDIADVENAFMMLGVHSNSQNQMDMRYLFDFFSNIYESSPDIKAANVGVGKLNNLLGNLISTVNHSIVIQDKRFKMNLTFKSLVKTRRGGVAGPKGSYTNGFGKVQYIDEAGQIITVVDHDVNVIRYQVTDASYIEIQIDGLESKYFVYGDYATTADETDTILLIPLDYDITSNYSSKDREHLYARSLHYVFNSRVVTKVKWYQRGAFKYLMIIASIIITFYNPPAGLAALAASTGISVVVLAVIINTIVAQLVSVAIRVFVKVFGEKLAMLVAIAAILYGGYQAITSNGIASLNSALEYVNLGNNLVAESYRQQFIDLQNDYEEFQDMISSEQEKIDKAKEQLDYNKYLAPLVVFGESPSDYYQRTVHSGNIGVLAIDAVTNYVDIALTLPKLNETIGENE